MKQSKILADEEVQQKKVSRMPDIGVDDDKFIQTKNEAYEVLPIKCTGDYVAIAPLQRSRITGGGIVVPSQVDSLPDVGLIVGLGENMDGRTHPHIQLGLRVKFIPRHKAADLTGEYPFYNKAEIAVYKVASIVAILPQVPVRMKTKSGALHA